MASEGETVLSYHDTLLRKSDVDLLSGEKWINDNLIAFWFDYLEHDLFKDVADSVMFISPQVAQFIKSSSQSEHLMQDVEAVSCAVIAISPSHIRSFAGVKFDGLDE